MYGALQMSILTKTLFTYGAVYLACQFIQSKDVKSIIAIPKNVMYGLVASAKTALGFSPYKAVVADMYRSYEIDNQKVAELYFKNGVTHIDINSADPSVRGAAIAHLTADKFLDFYQSYISILPTAAQIFAGPTSKDPISYIESQISSRAITFDDYDQKMIKAYVTELNKRVELENSKSLLPKFLQQKPFTESDIKAYLAFGDVYKGVGCSTAVRIDDNKVEFIRNLDWSSLGVLGNNTVHLKYLTGHTASNKPHEVHSITPLPGMFALTAWNDKGLMIALNEVTKMDTKRVNINGGTTTEFRIIEKILNNCSTLDEAISMLKSTLKPATSHILTICSVSEGKGVVVDILPTDIQDIIRIRPMTGDDNYKYVFTTNHFVNADGKAIVGSEGFSDSYTRYDAYKTSLENHLTANEVAKSAVSFDTVNTVIMSAEIGHPESMSVLAAIDNSYAANSTYFDVL